MAEYMTIHDVRDGTFGLHHTIDVFRDRVMVAHADVTTEAEKEFGLASLVAIEWASRVGSGLTVTDAASDAMEQEAAETT